MIAGNRRLARFSLLFLWMSGALLGCSSGTRPPSVEPEKVSGLTVIVAQTSKFPDWLEAVGTVRAAQSVQIASQTSGTIVEVRAKEGDRVQSGQVLAVIDASQQSAAVEQATAALTAAQKEVLSAESEYTLADATEKRYQQLFEKKSVSPQEFDEVKARRSSAEAHREMARAGVAQAEAALTQARTSLGYTQVKAPFSGVVTEKRADAGSLASPGVPLFTLEDTRSYRLEAAVDESYVRLVRPGESISVLLDSVQGAELHGSVAQIVPSADAASRSFLVKVALPADAHLRSGLFGRARFPRGSRTTLLIPRTTVVERGQLRGVYVVDTNQVAQLHYVTLGVPFGEQVEVLSGLQSGEKLVAVPGDRDLGGKQIAPHP